MKTELRCVGPLKESFDPFTAVKFDDQGLIPAIVQDPESGTVLMIAYMNRESLNQTIRTGLATFWSRSRQTLWIKGGTSGNFLFVRSIDLDCDCDALLILADPAGPACHTGHSTCFFRRMAARSLTDSLT